MNANIQVCSLDELQREGVRVVSTGQRTVAVFWHRDRVFAVDNRCPHMGFPLSQGTVADGILTCHWHHAKFDLAGGCAFDLFADDVAAFQAEVRDGVVWLDPEPQEEEAIAHHTRKLSEGLEQNLSLVIAKSVIGLCEAGREELVLAEAARFGVKNRAAGWSSGLSILTAMANVQPHLDPEDRARALYHGVVHVARNTQGQPPDFDIAPLDTDEDRPEQFRTWFRRFAEVRSPNAAERCLRTAAVAGLDEAQLTDLLFAASTDHTFMDVGHTLDFANKACELLDVIGWDNAPDVLSSVIPTITGAERMEETSSWQHPVDLPKLLDEAGDALDEALAVGGERNESWDEHRPVAESIPRRSPGSLAAQDRRRGPLGRSAGGAKQNRRLCRRSAADALPYLQRVRRLEHGPPHVHVHNAVDRAMQRAPSRELARGILDGAASVYLERFLNMPRQPRPEPNGGSTSTDDLLGHFDRQQQVDETAQSVADLLAGGRQDEVVRTLGAALLREDAGFHSFQIYDAALRLVERFEGSPEADDVLIGASRFLTAHAPTVRSMGQTYETAARLHRGEALHA